MLAIMLKPYFKNMKVIWDFVGHAHAILNVIEYEVNIVCPFYYRCFFIWTLLGK
jgi:hypothetical protein